MADFDPDEFLKEESTSTFDPDEFLAEELPVKQEQGVGILERRSVDILKGKPEQQIEYLKSEGYVAEREGDILKVRRPDDKEWKVVDPKGLATIGDALQDAVEVIPDIGLGMAMGGQAKAAASATGAAIKSGASAVKKAPLSVLDRLLSFSPVYRTGKAALNKVPGTKKATEAITKAIKDAAQTKPPKKFIDPFKVRRSNKQ
jgi:hypothetical protein